MVGRQFSLREFHRKLSEMEAQQGRFRPSSALSLEQLDQGSAPVSSNIWETTVHEARLSWCYADLGRIAYHNPLRWSCKMRWESLLHDLEQENKSMARPIIVKEFVGDVESKSYRASSWQELHYEHGVASAVTSDP
jgi:hypothetical protein